MKPIEQIVIKIINDFDRRKVVSASLIQKTSEFPPETLDFLLKTANGALLPPKKDFDLLNLFFLPTPDGRFVLGRLTPDFSLEKRAEIASGRRKRSKSRWENFLTESFFLHFLSVPPENLAFWSNNPILLYQSLLNQGRLPLFVSYERTELAPLEIDVFQSPSRPDSIVGDSERKPFSSSVSVDWDENSERWVPVSDSGRPARRDRSRRSVDGELLTGLALSPGKTALLAVLDSVLKNRSTSFISKASPLHFISGIVNFFPIRLRSRLTFASGLEFAAAENFRLTGRRSLDVDESNAEESDFSRSVLNLEAIGAAGEPFRASGNWTRLIERLIDLNRWDWFDEKLREQFLLEIEFEKSTANESFPPNESFDPDKPIEPNITIDSDETTNLKKSNNPNAAIDPNETVDLNDPFLASDLDESAAALFHELQKEAASDRRRSESSEGDRSSGAGDSPKTPVFRSEGVFADRSSEEILALFDELNDELARFDENDRRPSTPLLSEERESPPEKLDFEPSLTTRGAKDRLLSPISALLSERPERSEDWLALDSLVSHAIQNDYFSQESLRRFWIELCGRISIDDQWEIRVEYLRFLQSLTAFGDASGEPLSPEKTLNVFDVMNVFLEESGGREEGGVRS